MRSGETQGSGRGCAFDIGGDLLALSVVTDGLLLLEEYGKSLMRNLVRQTIPSPLDEARGTIPLAMSIALL